VQSASGKGRGLGCSWCAQEQGQRAGAMWASWPGFSRRPAGLTLLMFHVAPSISCMRAHSSSSSCALYPPSSHTPPSRSRLLPNDTPAKLFPEAYLRGGEAARGRRQLEYFRPVCNVHIAHLSPPQHMQGVQGAGCVPQLTPARC